MPGVNAIYYVYKYNYVYKYTSILRVCARAREGTIEGMRLWGHTGQGSSILFEAWLLIVFECFEG